ncbi:MAG: glycosyltransferase [Chitinophagaceae bacterium]|nr:glycosyltransferase [Chitinophagaceae bacterium]MDB5223979.1 glycosyltransferase [Chitinophagaceae bacterium]
MKKFSIILPVKNGGEYVKECVNSILSQTLNDFNLHVLDNCSSDGTLQWIQSLNDERIIIHPSSIPLSIEENWGRIVSIPKNEFITLIGHDDILKPGYLKVMNDLINNFPDATLYQTHFSYIDSKGKIIRNCKPMKEKESGPAFLQSVLQNKIDIVGTGFMMRSKDYDSLGGIPLYPNLLFADFTLWLNLAAKNYKATAAIEGFYFRLHQSTTSISSDVKYQLAFEKFIYFLETLKLKDAACQKVIVENADMFILHYCKSLSHRILRTPKEKREGLSVNSILQKCKEYTSLLTSNKNFNPVSNFTILLARMLDSNAVTRNLFLLFKKIYSKPVLK